MKKINLRLLSMMLGVITLFSGAPVRGESCFEDVKNKIGNIPFGVKVAVGVGITGVLTASAITAGYALAKSKSSSSDQKDNDRQTSSPRDHQRQALPISVCGYGSGSYPNANFYNTSNLCYWHALLQHLYDIKAFKKFIEEYDENLITDGRTKEKFLVLREIFNAMGECIGGVFSQSECEKFAESFFGKQNDAKGNRVLGAQQDFGEVCTNFMSDILNLYTKKYGCILTDYNGSSERTSNILTDSVKLEQGKELKLDDLLRENSPNRSDRFKAIDKYCWNNEESRLSILRRLPISCLFIRKEDDGILVSENGEFILDTDVIKGLFGEEVSEANSRSSCVAKKFSELPAEIKNPVVNDFDQDPKQLPILSNKELLKTIKEDWNSEDSNKKKAARLRIFSYAPIGKFIVRDEQQGKWKIDVNELGKLVNGGDSFEDAVECLKCLKDANTECVKDAIAKCDLPYIKVSVIDDQFSIFISRLVFNTAVNEGIKDDRPVDLGEGTVEFKGQKFELTAVTVHSGNGKGGHYYTYKKQGGKWWKYNDFPGEAPARKVNSWGDVKEDSKCKCVMMTFSKQGTNVKGHEYVSGDTTSILRSEPLNIERGYVSHIISKSNSNPKFSKDKFEIVKTGEGTQYPSGIVDRKLLSDKRYGKVAIVDAANTGGLGGGGVDGAIFRAMGGQNVVNDIRAKLPCYGNSDTRIKEGGAIVHGSYKIGEYLSNVRYVVQTVSPKIRSEGDLPLFYSAWYSAVNLGAKLGCNTIFMPGIGMGVFCENKSTEFAKKCAKVAVQAIKDAIEDSKASIKIVIIDHRDQRRSAGFFDELERMTNQFDM